MRRSFATILAVALLAPAASAADLSVRNGRPLEKGLGKEVILTNLSARTDEHEAIKLLSEHRDAKILRFPGQNVAAVRRSLAKIGPEYVVVVVRPTTVDVNFHLDMLELCRDLDADPMPDFHFGYLSARDATDLLAFVNSILAREGAESPGTAAQVVALSGSGSQLAGLDYLLHFGHGQPWCVVNGMTGEQVGELALERHPVVWSGACYGGVLSRSYHRSTMAMVHSAPETIPPERLLTLNWVHAGVSGYFGSLEADRGEMAMAEWDYFRERACSLGEVIGYQYRLAFTSLPEDFEGFPRFQPGGRKDKSFYGVMMNGMISRLLLSDPMLRPLAEPLDPPATDVRVEYDEKEKRLVVTIAVKRWCQGQMLNYLPYRTDRFDRRIYRRVRVPDDVPEKILEPTVRAKGKDGSECAVHRHHVRHEVWGGARYLNVQAEAKPQTGIAGAGAEVVFEFPVKR